MSVRSVVRTSHIEFNRPESPQKPGTTPARNSAPDPINRFMSIKIFSHNEPVTRAQAAAGKIQKEKMGSFSLDRAIKPRRVRGVGCRLHAAAGRLKLGPPPRRVPPTQAQLASCREPSPSFDSSRLALRTFIPADLGSLVDRFTG